MVILVIFLAMPVLDVLAWWVADGRMIPLRRAAIWRWGVALFMASMLGGYAWLFCSRVFGTSMRVPAAYLIAVYLWHLIILPAAIGLWLLGKVGPTAARIASWMRTREPGVLNEIDVADGTTRRQMISALAASVPAVATLGASGVAYERLNTFRIRRMDVAVPGLPLVLSDLKIAHVSDTHVGRLTNEAKLAEIVRRTNELNADLVLFTGDLIDFSLSDLPRAVEMVKAMRSRYGLFMCEGNHDLFQDRLAFRHGVRGAGIELLMNESCTVEIRGQTVQILGIPWNGGPDRHDGWVKREVDRTLSLRHADAFPILLAHHPHAFDPAAAAGIPLTLSGHTHGGQIMLNKDIGPGPWMYRYWSGLYQRAGSSLVVSNGVGNWFPLRINAPAEIVEITLKRA